ncbi:hypothetical protein GOP47_0000534 [Adiantum capillus-veneris]|uniref:BHLH domain-containing protein n=1 Tax=Adiantum capillus-veneris TaxID=13818 RepID=A0A9D4VE50_ADICA|nr:hypothetical protein GOP47_0000534 [Adiantum capillus-veneris]
MATGKKGGSTIKASITTPMQLRLQPQQIAEKHIVRERMRREDMSRKFAELEALLPAPSASKKRDRSEVVDDAIMFVVKMQDKLKHLQASVGHCNLHCNDLAQRNGHYKQHHMLHEDAEPCPTTFSLNDAHVEIDITSRNKHDDCKTSKASLFYDNLSSLEQHYNHCQLISASQTYDASALDDIEREASSIAFEGTFVEHINSYVSDDQGTIYVSPSLVNNIGHAMTCASSNQMHVGTKRVNFL